MKNQNQTILDLKSIFDIFPHKFIDQGFTFLINGKFEELKYTLLDEAKEKEKTLFEIFDQWLLINFDNNLDLNYNCGILEINYDFTSKYYFHLFKSKNMQLIVDRIRRNIISFFLGQNNGNNYSAESLIFLLLNSPNDQFCLYILDQMSKFIMSEEDFYQKEENGKYQLFKLFWERCGNLYRNPNISDGKYLNETAIIRNKIIYDINKQNIVYELINNLIDEPQFKEKFNALFINEKVDLNKIFNELKENVEFCREQFDQLEKINDYLNSFFSNTKKQEIQLINEKLININKKKFVKL